MKETQSGLVLSEVMEKLLIKFETESIQKDHIECTGSMQEIISIQQINY